MIRPILPLTTLMAVSLAFASVSNAQSFYVDVTNETENAQVHRPTGTPQISYDFTGAGFSAGSSPRSAPGYGTYYIADGFYTGFTTEGLWEGSWLDVLSPDPDVPPHGGLGTVDIIAPGGVIGDVGFSRAIFGSGLSNAPVDSLDTNGQFLGIGAEPLAGGSEYALWATPFVVATTTTYQFQYYWAAAGATLLDDDDVETEIFDSNVEMGAQFFVLDGTTDYSTGDIAFSSLSALQGYEGAGNQTWLVEGGTFTLDPGTYYWGFSATGNSTNSYIVVDSIAVTPVPEPSGAILAIIGAALFSARRRRVNRA